MASSDQTVLPKAEVELGEGDVTQESSSMEPQALPGHLPWEKDLEMVSNFLDRKEDLIASHKQYISDNPELKAILADFFQALLIQRPDNVYEFAHHFFTPFDPQAPHAPSYPSHKPSKTSED